jgi:hypothetical protein
MNGVAVRRENNWYNNPRPWPPLESDIARLGGFAIG